MLKSILVDMYICTHVDVYVDQDVGVGVRVGVRVRVHVKVLMLIIHSLKSIAGGMLGSAETSKIQADVPKNWVTVVGGDAEFIKKSRF